MRATAVPSGTAVARKNVISGQLRVLLQRLNSDSDSSEDAATSAATRQRIRDIIDAAGYVSDVATPYIQLRQPLYYNGTPPCIGSAASVGQLGCWQSKYDYLS